MTISVHRLEESLPETDKDELAKQKFAVVRIASETEFASSPLCHRPKPRYYDPYRIASEVLGKQFVIVRPDRFTFATCANVDELRTAMHANEPLVSGHSVSVNNESIPPIDGFNLSSSKDPARVQHRALLYTSERVQS